MVKVVLVFGTRPEAIKMAPVIRALAEHPRIFDWRVCVTAQHRELLDQVLAIFGITSHHDLNIMTPDQDLYDISSRTLSGLRDYLAEERPDYVLVHGDTTTTFAAALAAFYQKVPVGHVEAGLRTNNRYSPYPEEMNRRLTSAIASLHFAPTSQSCAHLHRENVERDDIFITGNTAIDALRLALSQPNLASLPNLFPPGRRGLLVTAHRRENFGPGIRAICGALRSIATRRSDVHIVYPVHPNPNIRVPVREVLADLTNVTLLEPLEYDVFVRLMADSYLVLTDSGGVQEEAPSLGKPVLVLRECTERPEAVAAGTVLLAGNSERDIVALTERLLDDGEMYESMARAINPYGDGRAAIRIVSFLARRSGLGATLVGDVGEFGSQPDAR
jgi:UDP-N-acetylglucosamine 2-epimerase (non-hydrolysing)